MVSRTMLEGASPEMSSKRSRRRDTEYDSSDGDDSDISVNSLEDARKLLQYVL